MWWASRTRPPGRVISAAVVGTGLTPVMKRTCITTNYDTMELAGHESGAELLGTFRVSIFHNIVHLRFGVAGLMMARATKNAVAHLTTGCTPWGLGTIGRQALRGLYRDRGRSVISGLLDVAQMPSRGARACPRAKSATSHVTHPGWTFTHRCVVSPS